jgi:hypothetical protein
MLAPYSMVSAQPPDKEPYTFEPSIIEGVCDFPIYWDMVTDKSTITVFYTPNRDFTAVTGVGTSTMTNMITGKSTEFLIKGTMEWFTKEDGSFVMFIHGLHINFFYLLPGLNYVKGTQMVEFDPQGNLVQVKTTGNVIDMCAVLSE